MSNPTADPLAQRLRDTAGECYMAAADKIELLQAAVAVDLQYISRLEVALRNLIHAARTSGGVAGRDEYLCQYCTEAEYLMEHGYER